MKRYTLSIAVLTSFLAAPAFAGWASLGRMPAPQQEDSALVFRNEQGILSITPLSAEVVRVRFSPAAAFGRDHSYAVVSHALGDPKADIKIGAGRSSLATADLRVEIQHDPLRIRFLTASGESLDEDDAERGIAFAGSTTRVWKRLLEDEHVYGFGEKNGRLDKRAAKLGGYAFGMWNTDTYAYDLDTDPIYVSVPFFMVLRKGRAHGIFFDNTHRSSFDVGHESHDLLSFGAEGGELDYYFIDGPTPKDVIERYTQLTGRMPLPPLWALGYHQCRYSYYPDSKVRAIADSFRTRHIPADALWLDIHYQDGYRPFTWDPERFPNPKKLIADLRAQGFRLVTIVDPHPAKEVGYAPYDTGLAGDHFIHRADGQVYEGPVWPSKAEKHPELSVFPDFSRPATRAWWGSLYGPLLDLGVAGIWNDMNEPSVFDTPTATMPLDNRHDNEGQPTDHREIHNVYGMLMARASFEGLQKLRPNERPFVLSRASFAGGQRYSALWPGDNQSDWGHLRGSLTTLMGLGLSGFPFVGGDIGGFTHASTPELYTRWMEAAVFSPFMRTHAEFGSPDKEPWSHGTRYEAINRRMIELRYEMLPEIYNVMKEASDTGLPALRPLMLEFPDDEATYEKDDQYLFGSDLLVAPVMRPAAAKREVYLPRGDWYDYWTGARSNGGQSLPVNVTLESLPLYVRGGAFLFRHPVVQNTDALPGQPLLVDVYPAPESRRTLYEDDGHSLEYAAGAFLQRDFAQRRKAESCEIAVSSPRGSFRPESRDLVLRVRTDDRPLGVQIGDTPIKESKGTATPRWTWDPKGWVSVYLRDRFEAFTVTVRTQPAPPPGTSASR